MVWQLCYFIIRIPPHGKFIFILKQGHTGMWFCKYCPRRDILILRGVGCIFNIKGSEYLAITLSGVTINHNMSEIMKQWWQSLPKYSICTSMILLKSNWIFQPVLGKKAVSGRVFSCLKTVHIRCVVYILEDLNTQKTLTYCTLGQALLSIWGENWL